MQASQLLLSGTLEKPKKSSNPRADEIRMEHFKLYTENIIPQAEEQLQILIKQSPQDAIQCADERYKLELIRSLADGIAVDNLIVPPEWSGWVTCARCEEVPYLDSYRGETVQSCPWCHSEGMQRTTKALKRLSVCPDIEARELKELTK